MLEITAGAVNFFIEDYRRRVVQCLESVPGKTIRTASRAILNVLNEGTLYIFGNGGSHALSRQFENVLRNGLLNTDYRLRANTGINTHFAPLTSQGSYKNLFTDVLEVEKADSRDLIVFVSGSGDSDNLVEAADLAHDRGIATISFSGFGGGKIAQKTQLPIAVYLRDQQAAEDTIQPLLHLVAETTIAWAKRSSFKRAEYQKRIADCLAQLDASFVLKLGHAISDAFLNQHSVYVVAPEGQGMSMSAEHTAHNFNWDAVFGLHNPPPRYLYSASTSCDFSGVGNDRLVPGIVTIQQLDKARSDDVLLLFVHNPNSPAVVNALQKAKHQRMKTFLVSGKSAKKTPGVERLSLHSSSIHLTADLHQMFGHITARVLRLCLKQKLIPGLEGEAHKMLIDEDMAQRRLLTMAGTTLGAESYA